ncbi:hypothetical protein ACFFNY_22435 [Paenibacillus hodogayensis]|uniref:PRD domain-containing protein n=1 Tax=Paenibacillus hodogayensis TaxID=279208 RepID=A0ABV5W198_9BACL
MLIDQQAIPPVLAQLQGEDSEKEGVSELLLAVLRHTGAAGIRFTPEQLLAVGAHMLAAQRRGESGEALPEVGAETLEQVSPSALELSRSVLEPFAAERQYVWNATEALLLAVHFEAAMEE